MLKYLPFFAALLLIGCQKEAPLLSDNSTDALEWSDATFQETMLVEINGWRANGCQCGGDAMPVVASLDSNDRLAEAALKHARDMYTHTFFDHRGSDGSTVGDRATSVAYPWMQIGENIAWNQQSVPQVVKAWVNSPAHCRLLMSADFAEMGAARVGDYWVLVAGKSVN